MNVLVLNLTRLGDLLQSQPAIADLRAAGHRVGLVCLDNFAGAAGLMNGLDAVFPLPGARLLARLDRDWREAVLEHRRLLDAVRADFPPDAVINLTPSEPARLLALALAGETGLVRGFAMDAEGFNADTSLWAAFLQLAAKSRGASPFNIVDIFRRMAAQDLGAPSAANAIGAVGAPGGLGLRGPSRLERAHARERLLTLAPPPRRGYVALQLGASADARRWPVAHFAQVARGLAETGHTAVLLGAESERPLAERFKAAAGVPVADLVGGTTLPELAAALCACSQLITNDTGTMHLAAGLGVPCLAIFLATAQPWDTGPYLPGCLCLEPDLPCHPCGFGAACPSGNICRGVINPDGVLALSLLLLNGGELGRVCAPGARVWRTGIGADGLMDLVSLSGHDDEERTRFIRLQRRLYLPYLDGAALEPVEHPADMKGMTGVTGGVARPLAKALGEALDLLTLLSRQGELLARDPLPAMKTKFLATWQRIRSALESTEQLSLLAALWVFQAERPGLDLTGILALAARFAALLERIRADIVAQNDVGTEFA